MKNILAILIVLPIFLVFCIKENTPGIPLNDTMALPGDNHLFDSALLQ